VAALKIGNEPELYDLVPWYELANGQVVPWYRKRRGTPVLARAPGYDFAVFNREFARFRAVLPTVPLAGPSTGSFHWLTQLPQFISSESPLSMVTFHRYGLNGCLTDQTSPHYPSVPNLLAPLASRGIMRGVTSYVALAHASRLPFRIDEMNSVTCGGRIGVSNTFASALWALDALFDMASEGVDGVNIHTFPNSPNGLFDVQHTGATWVGEVHPEYYGLMMFAQAAPPGAKLLTIASTSGPDVRSWATLAPDGTLRAVLINDSLTTARTVAVRAPGLATTATLERLQAPSAFATSGITIGGRSFGPQTNTGLLTGKLRLASVTATAGGFPVSLPASSAAMLTWKP
jgi:hypothetical protein